MHKDDETARIELSRRRFARMSVFSIAAGVFAIAVGIANVFIELIGGVGWSIVLVVSGVGAVAANYRVLRFLGVRKAGEESGG